ncbi:3-oxoacyl-(acyl carrier protein) synthase III [Vibrio ichthyoenteri ATCC 700023]|uniref:Beta-ketoacyl-[acyl-carrier-protein] synthase III n=1 Tax=Vibrio ichthyoenteri ATCC 700023 TaxID=870968 RepID=F9S3S3_9VIBR|nr:ketoacyl-ACP synthase III [Vibrio ichthyoenteri]EGU37719.1 3-oxoacyl-(acyl carrier protein) synthase III [Vibrio ichthyoenteri ATCC 700023]
MTINKAEAIDIQVNYAQPNFAEITGWGKCLPPATLTNDDLSTFLETSDEWIQTRTGIEQRRISHVETSEMATVAAKQAIACAGLQANDIDLIIIATCSPDSLIPNIASKVSQNLDIQGATAFDLNAACTGFVYGLETATRLIQAGNYQHALVVGAERLSFYIDWTQRDTAVLFGDGAGAVVLSKTTQAVGLQHAQLGCDAQGRDILAVPKFGTSMARFAADNGYWSFNFVGKEIFKRAVKGMSAAAQSVLTRSQLSTDHIDVVIPHQANIRIIQTLCDIAGINQDKAFINIQKYGNTSAATVPIALCEAMEQDKIKAGDNILLAAFGAGLTWGAGHIKWGERVTPLMLSDAALPDCQHSALELLQSAIEHCKNKSV